MSVSTQERKHARKWLGYDPADWQHPNARRCSGAMVPEPAFPTPLRKVPHVAWRPVYDALASLIPAGGPLFEITREKSTRTVSLWVRRDRDDRPMLAGRTPGEADGWCRVNVDGYAAARDGLVVDTPKPAAKPAAKRAKREEPRTAPVAVAAPVPPENSGSRIEERPAADLPAWAVDYLARLVFEQKRDYAAAYLRHRLHGAPAPEHPGREWADKVHARVDRLEAVALEA